MQRKGAFKLRWRQLMDINTNVYELERTAAEPMSVGPKSDISSLYDRWSETERLMAENLGKQSHQRKHEYNSGMTDFSEDRELSSLAGEQIDLLNKLINSRSEDIDDVRKKLLIWKDLVSPGGQNETWLQPADRLVLSAIRDLEETS